jgi:branched-chain amino acid transport system ATP-binding protein
LVYHPKLATEILMSLKELIEKGMTILLLSQEVFLSLQLAHRAHALENGRVVLQGTGDELSKNEQVRKAYLGM